ncbi:MAG: LiaF domain-containing protein [Melioribacteraceae bacterium]
MQNSNGRYWFGLILVIIGGLWILENFGFPWFYGFDFHHLVFSWHTIFLIIGSVLIINHKDNFLGYIFLGIGAFGLLKHFPFFSEFDFGDLWPILLLFAGLWLVFRKNENSPSDKNINSDGRIHEESKASFQQNDLLDESSIFNSVNKIIRSDNFRGGKITTIFGGTKIDLSQSKLAPGENTLELTTIFGGAELHVPPHWKVLLNVTSIFGGFEDKRYSSYKHEEPSEGILIIKGVTLFGGGELLY